MCANTCEGTGLKKSIRKHCAFPAAKVKYIFFDFIVVLPLRHDFNLKSVFLANFVL